MLRTGVAFPATCDGWHRHNGLKPLGIHGRDGRLETDIYACLLAEDTILSDRARIFCEILRRSKLCRIHKDADDQSIRFQPGGADQCPMAIMQSPHRRHKADLDAFVPEAFAPHCHGLGRADNPHELGCGLQDGRDPYLVDGWGKSRRTSEASTVSASIWLTER